MSQLLSTGSMASMMNVRGDIISNYGNVLLIVLIVYLLLLLLMIRSFVCMEGLAQRWSHLIKLNES